MSELDLYDIDVRFMYDLLKTKHYINHHGGTYQDGVYIVVDNRHSDSLSRKQKKAAEILFNQGLLETGKRQSRVGFVITRSTVSYSDNQHPYLVPDDTQEIVDRGFVEFQRLYPILVEKNSPR